MRELENTIERMVVLSQEETITENTVEKYGILGGHARDGAELSLPSSMAGFERAALLAAYRRYGSTRKMAEALGVSQPTVVRKMRKHGITVGEKE